MGRALETDLYELTMAAAYVAEGAERRRAACEAFVRKLPPARGYLVAAGLEAAVAWLEELRFEPDELDFLAGTEPTASAFRRVPRLRDFLAGLRFRGDVHAVPEGTIVLPDEPLLRVEAEVVEAQLAETFLLSALNHATTVATKAARIVLAAEGRACVEFGSRRTHPGAAIDAARAAYLAGFAGTSNVEAGRRFGIPVVGTAAHMWTMFHASEPEAFARYHDAFPAGATYLVDTYDSLQGVEHAIAATGGALAGVRLDSGDFLALSGETRRRLDARGLHGVRIVASGDLDEHAIAALVRQGAPIDVFGVGTELVLSRDAPTAGAVYKLVAAEREGRWVPAAKLSAGKATLPGRKQIFRVHLDGALVEDLLGLADEPPPPGSTPLLVPVLIGGRRVRPPESPGTIRDRVRDGLAALPPPAHALGPPPLPPAAPVRRTAALAVLHDRVRADLEATVAAGG